MKRKGYLLFASIGLTLCLASCGSQSTDVASNDTNFDGFVSDTSYSTKDPNYESSDYESAGSQSEADIVKNTMMIIRDASLSIETDNIETFSDHLHDYVDTYDGYFEDSTINDYDSEYSTSRWAYFTVRIPQKSLDDFLSSIDNSADVTSRSITSEDVSLEYVDVQAKINSLETEKDNLLRLLDEAQSVSDIIEIQGRLSDVQYELDSYNSRRRLLESRVSYSTVDISVHEERNIEHPIRRAFEVNFKERMIEGIENGADVFVGIITSIPVIIIVTAFVIFFIWMIRKIWRKIFKKHMNIKYMWMPVQITDETAARKEINNGEDQGK